MVCSVTEGLSWTWDFKCKNPGKQGESVTLFGRVWVKQLLPYVVTYLLAHLFMYQRAGL